jgi:predicted HAD superfamily Cof-like phosphohydrolase
MTSLKLPEEIDRLSLVKKFQSADPTYPSDKEFHYTLIREEINEVAEAYAELLKELTDLEYVLVGATAKGIHEYPEDIVGNLYAFEHLYQAIPSVILNEAFVRVHKSNMSKLTDGKLVKREDGKILKPDSYEPPNMMELV